MRALPTTLSLPVLVLALAGCFEEEREVKLVPGGAGTMRLEVQVREDLSRAALQEGEEKLRRDAAAGLASWEGVAAWSDVDVATLESRIAIRGTAWFEDVEALRREGQPFLLLQRDGQQVTATLYAGKVDPQREPVYARFLELSPEQVSAELEQERRQLAQLLEGFRLAIALELPAVPERTEGFQIDGRTAHFTLAGEEMRRELEVHLAHAEEVAQRARAGELTREEALKLLAERERALSHLQPRTVTWTDPPADDPARAEFQRRLSEVRAAWETSEWHDLMRAEGS